MKKYIGIRDVSRLTGISVSTLYKLTASGSIPYYKPSGKLLFSEDEIVAWIEASRVCPQADANLDSLAF